MDVRPCGFHKCPALLLLMYVRPIVAYSDVRLLALMDVRPSGARGCPP